MGGIPKGRLIILGGGGLLILFFILFASGVFSSKKTTNVVTDPNAGKPIVVWGVVDAGRALTAAANAAKIGTKINYKKFNLETYEEDLLRAFARDQAPDVFMIQNTWLPKHSDKLVPASSSLLPIVKVRDLFPQVVEQDFAPDGKVYALPLYLDTLALFYNTQIFANRNIVSPPKDWEEFQALISRLREVDANDKVLQAAAAIGGSGKTVNRVSDLISLLMLQTGAEMTDAKFRAATFSRKNGLDAFLFYLKFSNPSNKDVYTWNDSLPYSLDWFAAEKVAMMFNYSHAVDILREKNQFLRFAIASVPQPQGAEQKVNFANYWGLAVSKKSKQQNRAWAFIEKFTTSQNGMQKYAELVNRPPALRSLIEKRLNDPKWRVFAEQALTARSWPQIDNQAVDEAFSEMVTQVLSGSRKPSAALQEAEKTITGLMQKQRRL